MKLAVGLWRLIYSWKVSNSCARARPSLQSSRRDRLDGLFIYSLRGYAKMGPTLAIVRQWYGGL